jgi:hypothetical protein
MEDGTWVTYEYMRAWVSSWHLVDSKRLQLRALYEASRSLPDAHTSSDKARHTQT